MSPGVQDQREQHDEISLKNKLKQNKKIQKVYCCKRFTLQISIPQRWSNRLGLSGKYKPESLVLEVRNDLLEFPFLSRDHQLY